jgi:phospholipase C
LFPVTELTRRRCRRRGRDFPYATQCAARTRPGRPKHGSLRDIEHVVMLMQENRSFDRRPTPGRCSTTPGTVGKRDNWLPAYRKADGKNGSYVMGYHTRADLPFQFALAEAFTVCDSCHCSVFGPTVWAKPRSS